MNIGLVIIGDEILSGRRKDRHQEFFTKLLQEKGHRLHWVKVLPDEAECLTAHLRHSMEAGEVVLSCGGIGATPDDLTRKCAARAAQLPLVRHPDAAALIEGRFGSAAYPHRVRMADLPQGASLIPNPVNQVPGFSVRDHHFMPGFPDMAHPMGRWVLESYYDGASSMETEYVLRVYGLSENELMGIMQQLSAAWPQFKLFSLPRMGKRPFVELGFRGGEGVEQVFARLQQQLKEQGIEYVVDHQQPVNKSRKPG